MEKDAERAEVKVQEGPPGFTFLRGEKFTFKYSFRAVENMKVRDLSTVRTAKTEVFEASGV